MGRFNSFDFRDIISGATPVPKETTSSRDGGSWHSGTSSVPKKGLMCWTSPKRAELWAGSGASCLGEPPVLPWGFVALHKGLELSGPRVTLTDESHRAQLRPALPVPAKHSNDNSCH